MSVVTGGGRICSCSGGDSHGDGREAVVGGEAEDGDASTNGFSYLELDGRGEETEEDDEEVGVQGEMGFGGSGFSGSWSELGLP